MSWLGYKNTKILDSIWFPLKIAIQFLKRFTSRLKSYKKGKTHYFGSLHDTCKKTPKVFQSVIYAQCNPVNVDCAVAAHVILKAVFH